MPIAEAMFLSSVLLGEWLRKRRRALDLTQKELDELSGVSQSYIAKIEGGSAKDVSRDKIVALAKALRVSATEPLQIAGYSSLDITDEPDREITYEHDPSVIPVPEGFEDLDDPIIQAGATRMAQAAYAEYMKAMRELRNKNTVGFGEDRYGEDKSKN